MRNENIRDVYRYDCRCPYRWSYSATYTELAYEQIGKAVSDMARYIDADKFTERIKVSPAFRNINDGLWLQRVVIDLLNNMPTADVVPKTEFAREIFEEIEKLCDAHLYWNNCSIIQRDDIAELKKKYTEGEKE